MPFHAISGLPVKSLGVKAIGKVRERWRENVVEVVLVNSSVHI